MIKNFSCVLIIFTILFFGGCDDQLAHNLSDLSNTHWQYKNSESRSYGYKDTIEQIIFYTNGKAVYRQQVSMVEQTAFKPEINHYEVELIYKYDSTSKEGVLISKDSMERSFEIRGNLLFYYGLNDNVTIYKIVKK